MKIRKAADPLAPAPPALQDHRANNFDFLRFLFASLVLFYHCFPLLLGADRKPAYFGTEFAALAGGTSVSFFFILSGFLVTTSWTLDPILRQYFTKRVLRIYPAFILAMLFCAFVAGPLGTDDVSLYWRHFRSVKALVYLFLLPADVVGPDMALVFQHQAFTGVIDGSCWTLRCEFTMYVVVVILGAAGLYRFRQGLGVLILFGLFFCFYAVSQASSHPLLPPRQLPWITNPNVWIGLMTFFLSGMTFCFYRDRIPFSRSLLLISLIVLLLTTLRPHWFSIAVPIFGAYVLFFIAFDPHIKLQRFARYGDFSYGMYLFAFPVQQLLVRYFGPELTPYRLFFIAFPLSLFCAVLSWHLVEKPCLRLKPRKPKFAQTALQTD